MAVDHHGGIPVKSALMATVTVTVRLSDVSVIKQEPVADPALAPVPATPVQLNVVLALEELSAVQPDMLVMPETDHE